jgi:uncharacterized membrane protein YhiD involved in acid resistance
MLKVLVYFFAALVVYIIAWTIFMLGNLFESLRRKADAETEDLKRMKLGDRVRATNDILKIIDDLVATEVAERMSFLLLANQKYNILNLNDDVNTIGKKIFESIKKEALLDDEVLVNEEYLMNYIITELTLSFTTSMKNLNIQVAANTENKT